MDSDSSIESWACTPGPAEKTLGAWVTVAGHFRTTSHLLKARTFDQSLLIYCIGGAGHFRLGGRTRRIESGEIFHVPPHVDHGYGSDPEVGWEIKWTHFQGGHAGALVRQAGFTLETPVRRVGIHPRLVGCFDNLISSLVRKEINYGIDAAGALLLILLELIKIPAAQSGDRVLDAVSVDSEGLEESSRAAGYSKYHFTRLFKRATGVTPWSYALRLKIDKAKEMLLSTDKTVKEIADELGYDDSNYFCRLFRTKAGMPPGRFRRLTRDTDR